MADQEQPDEVYLSAQLIRQWMAEYTTLLAERTSLSAQQIELQRKMNEVGSKIQVLGNKLRAAAPFSPKILEWMQEQEFDQIENVALTDAILKALLRIPPGSAMNRNILQNTVPQLGYPAQKLQANPNYLYIALKRLADRNLITEAPPGHFSLTGPGRVEAQTKR